MNSILKRHALPTSCARKAHGLPRHSGWTIRLSRIAFDVSPDAQELTRRPRDALCTAFTEVKVSMRAETPRGGLPRSDGPSPALPGGL